MGKQSTEFSALNCIDLSNPDINQSVNLLKQACLDSGFFYVVNHGISQEFMEEVFAQSKKFFSLPHKEKMKILRNEKHRGYTPVLDELLDPENQVHVGDYKEGYYIGVEKGEDDPESNKPFYGPNNWPAPGVLPGWRETMEKFHRETFCLVLPCLGGSGLRPCFASFLVNVIAPFLKTSYPITQRLFAMRREVGKAVAKIIALALDLDANFFDQPEMLGEPIATLRLLHYEGQVSDPLKGLYGAGAHTDYGLITLLATDDVSGLQICKDRDAKPQKWEDVAPLKGAFIVNLGDMLERWSNCVFKSTLHRVLGNGQGRYSIAYFLEPSHDCLVECLPTCKSDSNPPKFPPILCHDYLTQRYNDTHADLNVYKKQQA
ncbi:2-oxoglutarate-Fe(II) type oxidoreductase hxnY [Glycine max]|nr:2-oxoglutarate-Fe(II) type oxidoreductase hxnY [Glycine max]